MTTRGVIMFPCVTLIIFLIMVSLAQLAVAFVVPNTRHAHHVTTKSSLNAKSMPSYDIDIALPKYEEAAKAGKEASNVINKIQQEYKAPPKTYIEIQRDLDADRYNARMGLSTKSAATATTPPPVVETPQQPPPVLVETPPAAIVEPDVVTTTKTTVASSKPLSFDLPKVDLPKVDMPKVDLPKVELPKDLPKVELPKDLPKVDIPIKDVNDVPFIVKVKPSAVPQETFDINTNAQEKFAIMQKNFIKLTSGLSDEEAMAKLAQKTSSTVGGGIGGENAALSQMQLNLANLLEKLHFDEYGIFYMAGLAILLAFNLNKGSSTASGDTEIVSPSTSDDELDKQIADAQKAVEKASVAAAKSSGKGLNAQSVLLQSKLDAMSLEMEFKDRTISSLEKDNIQLKNQLETTLQNQNNKINELSNKLDVLASENMALTKLIEKEGIAIPSSPTTTDVEISDDVVNSKLDELLIDELKDGVDDDDDKIDIEELVKLVNEEKTKSTKTGTKTAKSKTKGKTTKAQKAQPDNVSDEASPAKKTAKKTAKKKATTAKKATKKAATSKKAKKEVKVDEPVAAAKASSSDTDNPWKSLSDSTLQRKTIKALSEYLTERGVSITDEKTGEKLKKADLLGAVRSL